MAQYLVSKRQWMVVRTLRISDFISRLLGEMELPTRCVATVEAEHPVLPDQRWPTLTTTYWPLDSDGNRSWQYCWSKWLCKTVISWSIKAFVSRWSLAFFSPSKLRLCRSAGLQCLFTRRGCGRTSPLRERTQGPNSPFRRRAATKLPTKTWLALSHRWFPFAFPPPHCPSTSQRSGAHHHHTKTRHGHGTFPLLVGADDMLFEGALGVVGWSWGLNLTNHDRPAQQPLSAAKTENKNIWLIVHTASPHPCRSWSPWRRWGASLVTYRLWRHRYVTEVV